jgi:hypothetical protein
MRRTSSAMTRNSIRRPAMAGWRYGFREGVTSTRHRPSWGLRRRMELGACETHRRTSNRLRKRIGFRIRNIQPGRRSCGFKSSQSGLCCDHLAGTAIAQTPRLITEEMMVEKQRSRY